MDLPSALKLKSIGKDDFIGQINHTFPDSGLAFGGHTVALTVKAALMTIDNAHEYLIHSVHNHFVYGVTSGEISFTVRRTKDGRGFCFRDVTAIQNNKTTLNCLVSFKSIKDQPTTHAPHCIHSMPSVSSPEDSVPIENISNTFAEGITEDIVPMEIRFGVYDKWELKDTQGSVQPRPVEPRILIWMKSLSQITTYGENGHRLALLLASDFSVAGLILKKYPHVVDMVASISLDHSVHFHTNHIDFNEWHLFDLECTFSGLDSITLNVSKIYSQSGEFVASVTQQALLKAAKL